MSDGVTISAIVTAGSVISGLLALLLKRLERMEVKVDGRLTQLLEVSKQASHSEGKAEGVIEERAKNES
jgi:hypothetical protein